MQLNEISGEIVDAAMKVHSALGPGLLESAYEACLLFELHKRGLDANRQMELPVIYEDVKIREYRRSTGNISRSVRDSEYNTAGNICRCST